MDRNRRRALTSICLRRSKEAANLPARVDQIHYVDFNESERELYRGAHEAAVQTLKSFENAALRDERSKYSNMLVKINSLRHMCNLGSRWGQRTDLDNNRNFWKVLESFRSAWQEIFASDSFDCSRCGNEALKVMEEPRKCPNEGLKNPILCVCGYAVCHNCIGLAPYESIDCGHSPKCHLFAMEDLSSQSPSTLSVEEIGYTPSKVLMLIRDIEATPREEKCVVFSFWVSTLQCIEANLEKVGISVLKIDGSLNQRDRESNIQKFKDDPTIKVILFSLYCGANGLNLTVANHAFLMEPQWNPMLKDQAFDRVHRIGQTKSVKTTRYIVRDTLEEMIRNIQQQKRNLAKEFLDTSRKNQKWTQQFRVILGAEGEG